MRIELQPIASVKDVEDWHPIVEMLTLFRGECAMDDIEWDDDELLKSYLEQIEDLALRADYESEPNSGIQAAKDQFFSELFELITIRQERLGAQSPFEIVNEGSVFLRRKPASETTEAGLAYAWLVIFWALSSGKDHVIMTKADRESFIREFSRVFECICCIVMAARLPSAVWYFGDSRDVREFLKRLEGVVSKAGNGAVKDHAQLEVNQVGANDAGIDVMAVTTRNGSIQRDSTAYLVGATIQKSDRRNKIIGIDQIGRFTAYFSRGPAIQYGGVLAIPYLAAPAEGLNCRDKNCAYIAKDEIIESLSMFPDDQHRRIYVRRPRRILLRKSRDWKRSAILVGKEGDLSVNWA